MWNEQLWSLSDLPPDKREVARSRGFDDGKTYIGDPDGNCEEVVVCPYCRAIVYRPDQAERTDCQHVAFLYDLANGEFAELDGHFKRLYPKFDLEGQPKAPGLKTYKCSDAWGIGGVVWGFWNPDRPALMQEGSAWTVETTLGGKEKPFEWKLDDNGLLSIRRMFDSKTGMKTEEKTILRNELERINNYVAQGWCHLANNVKKLRDGNERDGIGSFLYDTLGWNETDSQLASQLASLFTKSGIWHSNGKKINMQFKSIRKEWCELLVNYYRESISKA